MIDSFARLPLTRRDYGRLQGPATLLGGRVLQLLNSLLISILLVRQFGLPAVGLYGLGMVAFSVIGLAATLGMSSYLPRLERRHAEASAAAILLQVLLAPIWLFSLWGFATFEANAKDERFFIFLVGAGGLFLALSNTGLMLSIMQRRYLPGLLGPICEIGSVFACWMLARTVTDFAWILLTGRAASSAVIWAALKTAAISPRGVLDVGRASSSYMLPDILAMLSEQLIPLILAAAVSRGELGIFRLCQQLLTAADTPGWSFVQANYPDLVTTRMLPGHHILKQINTVGYLSTVLCLVGSVLLSRLVFHVPEVAPLMTVLSLTLIFRYRNNLFDQALRARGWIGSATVLASLKLLAGAAIAVPLIVSFKLGGAIASLAAISVLSGIGYQLAYARRTRDTFA